MFNSPIGRLFNVSSVGQEQQKKQSKKEDNSNQQNEEQSFFKEDSKLYSDISTEELDIELYVRKFFKDLKSGDISERVSKKIDDYLANFNKEQFVKKYGTNLTKEDLQVLLYSLAEKFGVKIS